MERGLWAEQQRSAIEFIRRFAAAQLVHALTLHPPLAAFANRDAVLRADLLELNGLASSW